MLTCLDKFHLNFDACQHQLSAEQVILTLDKTTEFIRPYLRNLDIVFMLWYFIFYHVSLQGISVFIMSIIIFKMYKYAGMLTFIRHTKGLESTRWKKNHLVIMGYVTSLSFWFRKLGTDYACGYQLKIPGAGCVVDRSEDNECIIYFWW